MLLIRCLSCWIPAPPCSPCSHQVDAEERAREAASQGLSRRLKESEGRGEALTDSVVELREALERQRQAADLREEMLKQVRVESVRGMN